MTSFLLRASKKCHNGINLRAHSSLLDIGVRLFSIQTLDVAFVSNVNLSTGFQQIENVREVRKYMVSGAVRSLVSTQLIRSDVPPQPEIIGLALRCSVQGLGFVGLIYEFLLENR